MPIRRLLILFLSCALILTLQASVVIAKPESSCKDPAGCIVIEPGEPVRLASLLVTELGVLGTEQAQAVELATDLRGDLAGHPIQLVHLGDGCNRGLAITTAEAVAADKLLVAVIGAACSRASIPVAPILGVAGITTISASSTSPLLTDPSLRDPFFFRTAYNDHSAGDALAEFLVDEGQLEAATVVDNIPAFVAVAERFTDQFTSLGGAVTNEFVLADGQDDFSVELAAIASEETDAVFFYTSQGAGFVTQARDIPELDATTLASTEIAQNLPGELDESADAEGLVFSLPDFGFFEDLEEPYFSDLWTPFTQTFEYEPTAPFHAYAFDATNRLMDIIESFQQGGSQRLIIPRTALRDAMAATTNYPGVTGSITCDSNGDCNAQEFVIHVVVGGVLEPA